jgi:hypothetical protein
MLNWQSRVQRVKGADAYAPAPRIVKSSFPRSGLVDFVEHRLRLIQSSCDVLQEHVTPGRIVCESAFDIAEQGFELLDLGPESESNRHDFIFLECDFVGCCVHSCCFFATTNNRSEDVKVEISDGKKEHHSPSIRRLKYYLEPQRGLLQWEHLSSSNKGRLKCASLPCPPSTD